jgi:hypothetical protein
MHLIVFLIIIAQLEAVGPYVNKAAILNPRAMADYLFSADEGVRQEA